jgi:hypothetical protein
MHTSNANPKAFLVHRRLVLDARYGEELCAFLGARRGS